jgi:hypothetical protein|tara:strand:- start:26 stop:175 length:150 start_codon:yes stop_codon:yes gene_type:complete
MIVDYNQFKNNLYLSIIEPIQDKMTPSDYLFIADKCLELETRIEEIQKR